MFAYEQSIILIVLSKGIRLRLNASMVLFLLSFALCLLLIQLQIMLVVKHFGTTCLRDLLDSDNLDKWIDE